MGDYSVVGKSVPRLDAWDKATGAARYAVDLSVPGMVWGKILRSPLPHARILSIDASRAERVAGVKAVVTGRDVAEFEAQVHPFGGRLRVLARDRVRFVGDEVAAVAAVDEDTAQEALELVKVMYEPLPPVFDPEEALKPEAPKLHPGGNLAARFDITRGEVEEAFKRADYQFEDEASTQVQHQCYLEPVGCVASFDASDRLTVWLSAMDPSGIRLSLARVLGLPEGRVRVVQAYCGGAFGGKIASHPVYPICALLAAKSGRPVKLVNCQEEEFLAGLPRLPARMKLRTAISKEGKFLAKETEILADTGAYLDLGARITAQMIVTPDSLYKFPAVRARAQVVYTNKSSVGAFRGFGNLQMLFALESHLDRMARELKMDPVELRLKNSTGAGQVSAHGWRITSCGLKEAIASSTQAMGWQEKRVPMAIGTGLGLACAVYDCGVKRYAGFSGSVAFVKFMEDGRAQVITGEADYGQGWSTVAAQMAAEQLGIPYEDVEVTTPDTDITPYAMGPWGLRLTVSGGNAVMLAAADARKKLLDAAAQLLEANPNDLEINGVTIMVKGSPERSIPVAEMTRHAIYAWGGSAIVGKGIDEPEVDQLQPGTLYGNVSPAYSFAAQAVEVELDEETGKARIKRVVSAHDMGQPINLQMAEGQIEGGAATGFGFALSEEIIRDRELVLNPEFLDYRLPTSLDVPEIESIILDVRDQGTPYGAKSVGQLSTMTGAPAVANAIFDALGMRIANLPLTPDKVLRALEEKNR